MYYIKNGIILKGEIVGVVEGFGYKIKDNPRPIRFESVIDGDLTVEELYKKLQNREIKSSF